MLQEIKKQYGEEPIDSETLHIVMNATEAVGAITQFPYPVCCIY